MNPFSRMPLATGCKFTQPRVHLLADPRTLQCLLFISKRLRETRAGEGATYQARVSKPLREKLALLSIHTSGSDRPYLISPSSSINKSGQLFRAFFTCAMHISCKRAIYRLPILTSVVALIVILSIYIRDLIESSNVEYVPVPQIAEKDLRKVDFAGMDPQDILFYNRVPKTGSSSMKSMLTKLQVGVCVCV